MASDDDAELVDLLMQTFQQTGSMRCPENLLQKIHKEIASVSILVPDALQTVQRWEKEHGYLLCPHTAIAATAAEQLGSDLPKVAISFIIIVYHWLEFFEN